VTVEGVITGDFVTNGQLGGFFMQELEVPHGSASLGLFVRHEDERFGVGSLVRVRGVVAEEGGLTQLGDAVVEVVGSAPLPEPVEMELPLDPADEWERYEGMLVTVSGPGQGKLVVNSVAGLGRGGVFSVGPERVMTFTQRHSPDKRRFREYEEWLGRAVLLVDDGSLLEDPHPVPYSSQGDVLTATQALRAGDLAKPVTGILSQGHSGWEDEVRYRLQPTGPVELAPANPRPAAPPRLGNLRVAAFNVGNLFNGDGQGGDFPTPRGALFELEYERQLAKLLSALLELDADLLGLVEIENEPDGDDSALAQLSALLSRYGSSYEYVRSGVTGSDETKVALLYRPEVLQPICNAHVLDSGVIAGYDDRFHRPAVAQAFRHSSGEVLIAGVTHLRSKGSTCSMVGDVDAADGQGECNGVRTAGAQALAGWLQGLGGRYDTANLLLMGDLNAYPQEDPVTAIIEAGFEELLPEGTYSYVWGSQAGLLDHLFATPSLAGTAVQAGAWHINADEPAVLGYEARYRPANEGEGYFAPDPYRSSDHDPVYVDLRLD